MSLSIKLTAAAIAVTAAATTGSAGAEQRERATLSRLTDSRQHLSLPLLLYARAHNCWSISCCCSQQQCDLIVCVRQKYENKIICIIYKNLHACKDLLPLLNDLCNCSHTHTQRSYTCNAHCVRRQRRAPVNCYCTLHWKSMQLIMHLPITTTTTTACSGKE